MIVLTMRAIFVLSSFLFISTVCDVKTIEQKKILLIHSNADSVIVENIRDNK